MQSTDFFRDLQDSRHDSWSCTKFENEDKMLPCIYVRAFMTFLKINQLEIRSKFHFYRGALSLAEMFITYTSPKNQTRYPFTLE